MLKDIVEVQALDGYRLKLRFEDGAEGVIDVSQLVPLTGVFAALRGRKEFAAVQVRRPARINLPVAELVRVQPQAALNSHEFSYG